MRLKLKIPEKLKFKGIKSDKLFDLFYISLITSLFIFFGFISLPLTEKVFSNLRYDIQPTNYWKKTYTIELDVKDQDKEDQYKKIAETKNIIYKRLNDYGVEYVKIESLNPKDVNQEKITTDETHKYLRRFISVTVYTSKEQANVETLIKSRNYIRFVLRKDNVNFDDPENQYAYIMSENYDSTQFTRYYFRNVFINKLKTSDNKTYSYFAIFKTWPNSEFLTFIEENPGVQAGVKIDGFVMPITLPTEKNGIVALSSAQDKEGAIVSSLLYNSGVVPVQYSVIDEVEDQVKGFKFEYIQILISLTLAVIAIAIYLFFRSNRNTRMTLEFILTAGFIGTLWISIYKLLVIPVDLFNIYIVLLLNLILIKSLVTNKKQAQFITIVFFIISGIISIYGYGIIKMFAKEFALLIVSTQLVNYVIDVYLNKIKRWLML